MLFRSAPWFTVALGLSLLRPCPGVAAEAAPGEPARLGPVPGAPLPDAAPSANQRMASAIAGQLRQSGQLRHYSIDLVFRDGSAEVSGTVADQPQREEVLRIVQGVPGVERVVDRLTLAGSVTPAALSGSILPAQAPPRLPDPLPPPGASGFPPAPTPAPGPGGPPPVNTTPPPPPEATPIFQAPAPSPYSLNPPPMPPYSWPTYAPYNNFSRVAYPEAYPYRAWPFIGPVYPFPKVPLGWRSVKLEWKDGYWWFSKLGNKYDWWRLRYW